MILAKLPLTLPTVINGEKQKDVIPGVKVALHILHNPNINPQAHPYLRPMVMAIMMTGMCIKVADSGPIRKNPNGVNKRISSIARKKANSVKFFVFIFSSYFRS